MKSVVRPRLESWGCAYKETFSLLEAAFFFFIENSKVVRDGKFHFSSLNRSRMSHQLVKSVSVYEPSNGEAQNLRRII
jgi:hypothetical protein